MVRKFHHEIHYQKGQENIIYIIVKVILLLETVAHYVSMYNHCEILISVAISVIMRKSAIQITVRLAMLALKSLVHNN